MCQFEGILAENHLTAIQSGYISKTIGSRDLFHQIKNAQEGRIKHRKKIWDLQDQYFWI